MSRLRQLAHYLRTQPPKDFWMGDCSTCILGTAARMPEFRLLGVGNSHGHFRFGGAQSDSIKGAADFFGASAADVRELFGGRFGLRRIVDPGTGCETVHPDDYQRWLISSRDPLRAADMVDAIADKYERMLPTVVRKTPQGVPA